MKFQRRFSSLRTSGLFIVSLVASAQAATISIGPDQITPSASVPSSESRFPISDIADGITNETNPGGLNGFVSNQFGTITLDFDQDYNLSRFLLWNDVNLIGASSEGINQFSLSFFDSAGDSIATSAATTYTAPREQLTAGEYLFAEPIPNVRSVELTVLSSQWNGPTRIEIREVAFTAIPEPSSALLCLMGAFALSRTAGQSPKIQPETPL